MNGIVGFNRRNFLKGSGILAAASVCSGVAAEPSPPQGWMTQVAVVGGGPAGVCAAVSAARLGAKVVLVERFGCLGGNLTLGHVSPILGKVSKGTMADEIRTLLNARHLDAPKVMTRNGPEEHIDHEEAKGVLAKLCADAGVTILLCCSVVDVEKRGNRVTGLVVDTPKGLRTIAADVVIDASGDGRVKSSADTLGVRETRRVQGDAVVTDHDVEEGRKYPDAVVHDAWFLIDIHNPKGGGQAEGHSKMAKLYDIRYGCLLPKGLEGILTAGRCISGTHRAHASYRVMTICMAMGEAAGVAAALAVQRGVTPRAVSGDDIRAVLKKRGVAL